MMQLIKEPTWISVFAIGIIGVVCLAAMERGYSPSFNVGTGEFNFRKDFIVNSSL